MYKLEDYKVIADEMIQNDRERDDKFLRIDAMHNVEWSLPGQWQNTDWIRQYPSTKPADALDTAIRALSTKEPQLAVMPILPNQETKDQFDVIERGLMWAWRQMGRRAQFNPTRAIVTSAIKYDEITAQLVHIPTHNESLTSINSKNARQKRQFGDFALIVHNPRNVHVQYSDDGFERVVLCKRQAVHKIVDFWGENANDLLKSLGCEGGYKLTDVVDVYDYWDGEVRCVWLERGANIVLMPPMEHKLGFIPWTCRVGGTNLEDLTVNQRRPMLNSIISGDLWQTSNLFRSLMLSLTMARAAEPTIKSTTPTGEGVEIDATEPMGQIKVRAGEDATKLPPSEIGQSIQGMYQMLGGEMEQAAGINLLQMNSAPSGMAFATYNAMIQSAMGSINPHKQTAEQSIADVFGLMVAWLKHSNQPLISYDDRKSNMNDGVPSYGTQEIITADMLPDLEDFCATVKLTEYVPTDELGRINGMTMLVQNLTYPTARALESLDVSDPKTAMEEWGEEQKTKASVMEEVKDLQFESDLIRQRKSFAMQMEQQQVQMQMQQQVAADQQAQQMQAQQAQQAPPQMSGGFPGADQMSSMPPGAMGDMNGMNVGMNGAPMPPSPDMQAPFDQTNGMGFAGNFGGSSPLSAAPDMTGVGLPALEGRDNRGLRLPPPAGRKPVQ